MKTSVHIVVFSHLNQKDIDESTQIIANVLGDGFHIEGMSSDQGMTIIIFSKRE